MVSLKLDDGMNRCSVYFDDKSEESYTATATHNHWVHYTSGPERQSENFAEYTEGNVVQAFLGGKEYFSALLAAFKQAKKCIFITGWQVNWDAQLAEGYGWLIPCWSLYRQLRVYRFILCRGRTRRRLRRMLRQRNGYLLR